MDCLSIPNVHKMIHDSKIIVAREPNADGTFRAIREPVVAILPQSRFREAGCPCSEESRAPYPVIERAPFVIDGNAIGAGGQHYLFSNLEPEIVLQSLRSLPCQCQAGLRTQFGSSGQHVRKGNAVKHLFTLFVYTLPLRIEVR